MNPRWPVATLGDVLRYRKQFITIDDTKTYRRPRVRLHAEGIVLRDVVDGASIKTKSQQICRSGDFLVAEIDAKVGGFGIVPTELAGAIVSSHYFLFETDDTKLDRRFLDWFIRTPPFREQVEAQGSTNYAAIRPADVLQYRVPAPPLAEQRRVVARIDELATTISEGQSLRQRSDEEGRELAVSQAGRVFERLAGDYGCREFGSFWPHVTSGPRDWAKCYEPSGLRFYRAQDIGPEGQVIGDSKVFINPPPGQQGRSAMLQVGDPMMVITGATVGRCAVFKSDLEQGFVSQHVAICRMPEEAIEPQFVLWGLRTRQGQDQLLGQRYGQGKPGLNLGNVRALTLPFPPLSEQQRIVRELDELESETMRLRKLQAESAAALNALMPAILDRAFKGEL